MTEIDWRRISDMVIHGITDPKIMIEGKDEGAVVQGALSNCWFVGALAVLATRDDLLRVCFVATKNWTRGIYTLKIYKEGQWRYVHIDDRIPCSRRGTPLYVRCQNSNETWALLLEKAYAKLHLSYENLAHGWLDYALRDLTGGLTTKMQLSEDDGSLFHVLKAAKDQDSLIGAIYNPTAGALLQLSSTGIERDRDLGILMGRAYGVLRMIEVRAAAVAGASLSDSDDDDGDEDVLQLVQLRDPWGLMQWRGRWSPNDVLWADYPAAHKQVAPFAEPRTFWMCWQDFRQQFNQVTVCACAPHGWDIKRIKGRWSNSDPVSHPGGCPNYSSFASNPQHRFSVTQTTRLNIMLAQPDTRWRKGQRNYHNGVGFVVMELKKGAGKRVRKFDPELVRFETKHHLQQRAVSAECSVAPGTFVLIPSTYTPEPQEYLLEIYADHTVTWHSDSPSKSEKQKLKSSFKAGNTVFDMVATALAPPEPPNDEDDGRPLQELQSEVARLLEVVVSMSKEVADLTAQVNAKLGHGSGAVTDS